MRKKNPRKQAKLRCLFCCLIESVRLRVDVGHVEPCDDCLAALAISGFYAGLLQDDDRTCVPSGTCGRHRAGLESLDRRFAQCEQQSMRRTEIH
jgi:hypothetical protein